jgi:hypothetical protein
MQSVETFRVGAKELSSTLERLTREGWRIMGPPVIVEWIYGDDGRRYAEYWQVFAVRDTGKPMRPREVRVVDVPETSAGMPAGERAADAGV